MKNTILITGNFNILHSGHLRLFRYAKTISKTLIVGVNSDKKSTNKVVKEKIRIENLKSINLIDEIYLIDDSVSNLVKRLRPDIILKGKEHENKFNIEEKILESFGGKLIFASGETFQTPDLFEKKIEKKSKKFINNVPKVI